MTSFLRAHEPAIRLGFFAGIFAVMALWEVLAPKRRQTMGRWQSWPALSCSTGINSDAATASQPGTSSACSRPKPRASTNSAAPIAAVGRISRTSMLDLAVYLQHVMLHAVPLLWRLHRMHHTDTEFDLTTDARFHPLEILLSLAIKLGVIAALGTPAVAVLIFEVLLNATSIFNRGVVRVPPALDAVVRWLLVTPDMHLANPRHTQLTLINADLGAVARRACCRGPTMRNIHQNLFFAFTCNSVRVRRWRPVCPMPHSALRFRRWWPYRA